MYFSPRSSFAAPLACLLLAAELLLDQNSDSGLWVLLLIPRDCILLTEDKKRGRRGEEFEGDEWTCCDILLVGLDILS